MENFGFVLPNCFERRAPSKERDCPVELRLARPNQISRREQPRNRQAVIVPVSERGSPREDSLPALKLCPGRPGRLV